MRKKNNQRFFITGTDTDCGKTFVTAALLNTFRENNFDAIGVKPVSAGVAEDGKNDDARELQHATSLSLPYETVNPICFDTPCSPNIAAKIENKLISLDTLPTDFSHLPDAHAIFIEGVGGWMVPIDTKHTFADYAKKLDAEIIFVVGIRLGCLNHSLLTCEQLLRSNLRVKGWIANHVDPDILYPEENIQTLKAMLPFQHLGELKFQENILPSSIIPILLENN